MEKLIQRDGHWWSALFRELVRAETVEQVLSVRSKAMMADAAARANGSGMIARNRAVALKLRAERKLGRMLARAAPE